MSWMISEGAFDSRRIEANGNRFLLSNGLMGYRGTLEEFGKEQLAACVLNGVYDQAGDQWREPVNAPNGLFTRVYVRDVPLDPLSLAPVAHEQSLDIRRGLHRRVSRFEIDSVSVQVEADRFCSLDDVHLLAMRYQVNCDVDVPVIIETGIDGDVWDINGPHLEDLSIDDRGGVLRVVAKTHELRHTVAVAEAITIDFGEQEMVRRSNRILRRIRFNASAGRPFRLTKFVAVYTSLDGVGDVEAAAVRSCRDACKNGYDRLLADHERVWADRWKDSDVIIEGDEDAQLALRYSIYHLLSAAPAHSDRLSIPARALSSQVYKGGIFWDTELFMLPFFTYTQPAVARNLVCYRCHTLDGARGKAAEYGYRGAFYAWESQERGQDACTDFNINDVFTGRPIRTYFRDKQIHISGDVVIGLWRYYEVTGDEQMLLDGGAEVILEVARFFFSRMHYRPDKSRYEILDVLGPDEYHDRVHNNAFTNLIARFTLDVALKTLDWLKACHSDVYADVVSRLDYEKEVENIRAMQKQLYIPEADEATGVIEQFDGYFKLEDVSLADLKRRVLDPNEYLGGHGPAGTTRIIKQADVVMAINLFRDRFSPQIKRANWQFYEPRTEHGSSLSACAYAIVAADIGELDYAYQYFMKTANIDLAGESKLYVGDLYIGGTHPAANGGAWMTAIFGFGGLSADEEGVCFRPRLPGGWKSLGFAIQWHGQRLHVLINRTEAVVMADASNTRICPVRIAGRNAACEPGHEVRVSLDA